MRESDVILFVVDAQDGLTPIDQELARILRKSRTPVVLVINKIDHPKHEDLESDFARLGFRKFCPDQRRAWPRHFGTAGNDRFALAGFRSESDSESSRCNRSAEQPSRPLALAIVGRPNAGKSSLINSILHDDAHHRERTPGHNARCRRHHV